MQFYRLKQEPSGMYRNIKFSIRKEVRVKESASRRRWL